MRLSISTSVLFLVVIPSLLSISPATLITAAPKTPSSPPPSSQAPAPAPPSVPSPAGATSVDKCSLCLAKELRSIPKCNSLTDTTPAPPKNDRDPTEIQDYKDKNPDVVACLCLAAKWTEEPVDWISKCDSVCMAAVTKNEKKVLKDFEARLSCNGGGNGSPPAAAAAAATTASSPQAAAQPAAVAPPVRKPAPAVAPVAAVPQEKLASNTAPALKPEEAAINKPDSKPAADVKEPVAAAVSPSNNSPNARDIKAEGGTKPAL